MAEPDRPEVCVKLSGRLGNQMFQYAAGFRLARKLGAVLTLDCAARAARSGPAVIRVFGLEEQCYYSGTSAAERVSRWMVKGTGHSWFALKKRGLEIVHERGTYDAALLERTRGCHLMGHWQSTDYFQEVEGEVRRIFSPPRPPPESGTDLWQNVVRSARAVAVHVRRGDYAANPRTRRRFGLCTRDYYDRARAQLEARAGGEAPRPHFFVFSDDPAAASQELAGWSDTTFVSGQSQEEDLRMMSLCREAIIANSTFSWWGAWLIPPAPGKRVIAPAQWFSPAMQARKSTARLCPRDWIRI